MIQANLYYCIDVVLNMRSISRGKLISTAYTHPSRLYPISTNEPLLLLQVTHFHPIQWEKGGKDLELLFQDEAK